MTNPIALLSRAELTTEYRAALEELDIVGNIAATQRERIKELEAENKRLREVVTEFVRITTAENSYGHVFAYMRILTRQARQAAKRLLEGKE